MSIELNTQNLSNEQINKINKDLPIKILTNSYSFNYTHIYPMEIVDDKVYIPFSYAIANNFKFPEKKSFPLVKYSFQGELRDAQKEVKTEAIDFLNKTGSVIISAYTGFGKSITSLYIAKKISLKTIIITHRVVLINQWIESIKKYCPDATYQELKTNSIREDCDFYIMNAINVSKKPRDFYKDIGTIIVDELHLIMSEVLSKCMLMINPRYVIGLSATPYREDGLDKLIEFYFGTNKIVRKQQIRQIIYKIDTKFVPEIELQNNGKVNWNKVIMSQCLDEGRNNMIVDIACMFSDRNFLIICKRVDQAKYIFKKLQEKKENVSSLIGKEQTFDRNSRILVGINSKTGTGFDFDKLDALILASDIEAYFQQVLGRVCRKPDVEPIIFDIVDKNPILKKHYNTRKSIYLESGGIIKDFSKEFPEFKIP